MPRDSRRSRRRWVCSATRDGKPSQSAKPTTVLNASTWKYSSMSNVRAFNMSERHDAAAALRNAAEHVPNVDDEGGLAGDGGVVEGSVIGHDQHAVVRAERLRRDRQCEEFQIVVDQLRNVRIRIIHTRTFLHEQAHDLEGRRLANIVHVALVRDTEH